jgi:hypothetical protein
MMLKNKLKSGKMPLFYRIATRITPPPCHLHQISNGQAYFYFPCFAANGCGMRKWPD